MYIFLDFSNLMLSAMVHTCNPRTHQDKAGRLTLVQCKPALHSSFKDKLIYIVRSCLKKSLIWVQQYSTSNENCVILFEVIILCKSMLHKMP